MATAVYSSTSWMNSSARDPYRVTLRVYEGPLDLLLFLVRRHEVDIYDIPIAEIADQFIEYLRLMEALNIEVAGDFIVLAATLAYMKSRMLLPVDEKENETQPEDGPDPRQELAQRLLEYRRFRQSADELRTRIRRQADFFPRNGNGNGHAEETVCLESVSIFDIVTVFRQILARAESRAPSLLEKETLTVGAKMKEIERRLWEFPDGLRFDQLVSERPTRLEVIVTFLAVLELARRGRITVEQRQVLGPILIYPGPGVRTVGFARS